MEEEDRSDQLVRLSGNLRLKRKLEVSETLSQKLQRRKCKKKLAMFMKSEQSVVMARQLKQRSDLAPFFQFQSGETNKKCA